MTWPRGAKEAGLAAIVALSVMLPLAFTNSEFVRGLETASLDLRFRLRGVRPPGPETAVILVDDRSLAALGRWPLSRGLFARGLQVLDRAGAKLVLFDLLFAERDSPVPSDLRAAAREALAGLPASDGGGLRTALQSLAETDPDRDFATAIAQSGRVFLSFAFAFSGTAQEPPAYLSDAAFGRFDKSPVEPVFPLQPVAAVLPIPELAERATGLGHVSVAYDVDGSPRYDYLAMPFNGDFLPSMPLRAAAAYRGVQWQDVGLALGGGVALGDSFVPTDSAMRLLINYRGPRGTFPTYSFVDLIEDRVPPEALRGRIVLIGASFIGIADSNPSPFGNTQLPGTERLATIIDTILHRRFVAENPAPWPIVVIGAVLGLALVTGAAIALLPTRLAALAGAVPIAAWGAGAQTAFVNGLWLPMVSPFAALAAASVTILLFRYRIVDREGRRIKSAFRHYLAPAMVNVLAAHPERLKLGGETRPMTLLFCDVRGFTTISEQFKANPQGLTHLINRFLTPMTDLIMARQGTIDKYMGDCIMAFWNAPLDDPHHADHACESALAMVAALDRVNAALEAEAAAEQRPFHALHVGIGLNTGECVVGNMGSDQRFDYSVLGDAVNLASRLEGQSKTYHVDIVIGEATRDAAPGWAALELDLIAVKGKREAVRIYTVLGDAALARSLAFQAWAERHELMLARYRERNWDEARTHLAECRGRDTRMESFYDLYEERIAYHEAHPPGTDWAGVFVAETK